MVFHGLDLIRLDAPPAQNATVAANLLHNCPKLRRIDVWHKRDRYRYREEDTYMELSRNDDGVIAWKVCKLDEWQDEWTER